MSIGIARLERLAHPHCTLRFVPLGKKEQARLTPDILAYRPHITREQLIERQRRGGFQTPPDTFFNLTINWKDHERRIAKRLRAKRTSPMGTACLDVTTNLPDGSNLAHESRFQPSPKKP